MDNVNDIRASIQQNLLDHTLEGIFALDLDGKFTFVNPQGLSLLGMEGADLTGRHLSSILPADEMPRIGDAIKHVINTGSPMPKFDARLTTAKGSALHIALRLLPLFHGGKLAGVIGAASDITDRVLALKALDDSLSMAMDNYRSIFSQSQFVKLIIDPATGDIIEANDSAARFYGYDLDALKSMKISDINVLSPQEVRQEMANAATRKKNHFDFRHRLANGQVRDVEVYSGPVFISGKRLLYSIVHDVTDRKALERSLVASEERFRKVVGESPIAIIATRHGRVIMANTNAKQMFGALSTKCDPGVPFIDFLAPEYRAVITSRNIEREGGDASPAHYEVQALRKDGTRFPIQVDAITLDLADGMATIAFMQDITERKSSIAALRQSEERLRLSLYAANQGLFDLDLKARRFVVNDGYAKMLGFEPSEMDLTIDSWLDTVHPDDRPRVEGNFQSYIDGAIPEYRVEYRQQTKAGGWIWKLSIGKVVEHDAQGQPLRMLGTHTDISETKDLEQELRFREDYLRSIIQNEPECVKLLDEEGLLLEMNPSGLAMIDAPNIDMLRGQCIYGIVAPEHREAFRDLTERVIRDSASGTLLFRVISLKGNVKWLETHAVPFDDVRSGKRLLLGVTRDVTETHLAQEALKQSEEALRKALDAKDMLMREIHHRTKNNLAILSSIISIQSHGEADLVTRAKMKEIESRVRALSLIHERLYRSQEHSLIQADDYVRELAVQVFDTLQVDKQRITLSVEAQEAKLDISTMVPCGLILNELITNAFKYGFPNGMCGEVRVEFTPRAEGYCISVSDSGVGLPEGFNMEAQRHTLGMQMIQALTKQINGKLEINMDRGTEFRLTFKGK